MRYVTVQLPIRNFQFLVSTKLGQGGLFYATVAPWFIRTGVIAFNVLNCIENSHSFDESLWEKGAGDVHNYTFP